MVSKMDISEFQGATSHWATGSLQLSMAAESGTLGLSCPAFCSSDGGATMPCFDGGIPCLSHTRNCGTFEIWISHGRRKFRSQTSDNMERWKNRGGKSQGGEVKKRENQRRERVGSKKMQEREKIGKSQFTLFFQWFGAPAGRKVTSLKQRVRSQLARWEMKNCTPLWREAHFQVKSVKHWGFRTTFWRSDVEKVHVVVARSTIPSQKCKKQWFRTTFGRSDVEKVGTD